MSSSVLRLPSTFSSSRPSCPAIALQNSSPPTSPKSSPLVAAGSRHRRAQYKSRTPSTPLPSRRTSGPSKLSPAHSNTSSRTSPNLNIAPETQSHRNTLAQYHKRTSSNEPPQKAFLRERFMARCLERVRRDRERAIHARRRSRSCDDRSDGSSDGPDDVYMDHVDTDGDEDEDDDAVMQDELFRRIMQNAERRDRHSYRVSYALEVGSSVDPDMEDIDRWENELRDVPNMTHSATADFMPDDLNAQELEEYAAVADFADIDELPDDFFVWSDVEDGPPPPSSSPSVFLHSHVNGNPAGETDIDMN